MVTHRGLLWDTIISSLYMVGAIIFILPTMCPGLCVGWIGYIPTRALCYVLSAAISERMGRIVTIFVSMADSSDLLARVSSTQMSTSEAPATRPRRPSRQYNNDYGTIPKLKSNSSLNVRQSEDPENGMEGVFGFIGRQDNSVGQEVNEQPIRRSSSMNNFMSMLGGRKEETGRSRSQEKSSPGWFKETGRSRSQEKSSAGWFKEGRSRSQENWSLRGSNKEKSSAFSSTISRTSSSPSSPSQPSLPRNKSWSTVWKVS